MIMRLRRGSSDPREHEAQSSTCAISLASPTGDANYLTSGAALFFSIGENVSLRIAVYAGNEVDLSTGILDLNRFSGHRDKPVEDSEDLLAKGLYAYNTASGTTSGPYVTSLFPPAGDTLFGAYVNLRRRRVRTHRERRGRGVRKNNPHTLPIV